MSVRESEDTSPPGAHLSRGELQDRAVKGAAWTMVHTLTSVPIAFLVNILIARVLGVVDYGRLAFLSTLMDVVGGVVSVGVGVGVVQFGAKAHARGDVAGAGQLLAKTQGFRLLIAAPLVAVAVVVAARVSVEVMVLTVVFGVFAPAFLGVAADSLTIENKSDRGAKNAIILNLITQAAVVAVVIGVGTADGVWATRLIIGGLGGLLSLAFVLPAYRKAILRPRFPRHFPDGFWRFAVPMGAAGVIGSLVVSRSEVLALTWLSTPAATGAYALAYGLANHMFSPAQALLGPLIPAISGLREVDPDAVGRALGRSLRASSTIVGLILGCAVPAFAVLVPLIYGDDFGAVPPVLLALSVAGGFMVVASPVKAFVLARLKGRRMLVINLIALAVDVALMIGLIPLLGVWGAVIANFSAAATQLGLLLASELRALNLSVSETVLHAFPAALGSLACLASWWAASLLLPFLHALVAALIAGLTGVLLTVVALRLFRCGLSADDGRAILRVFPVALARIARPLLGVVTQG